MRSLAIRRARGRFGVPSLAGSMLGGMTNTCSCTRNKALRMGARIGIFGSWNVARSGCIISAMQVCLHPLSCTGPAVTCDLVCQRVMTFWMARLPLRSEKGHGQACLGQALPGLARLGMASLSQAKSVLGLAKSVLGLPAESEHHSVPPRKAHEKLFACRHTTPRKAPRKAPR